MTRALRGGVTVKRGAFGGCSGCRCVDGGVLNIRLENGCDHAMPGV